MDRPLSSGSFHLKLSISLPLCPPSPSWSARARALPRAGGIQGSAVSRARQAVQFQVRPTPGVCQAWRPQHSPLTWHSKPSRPWWFSAPSPGAVHPRCPCHPGPHIAELPWRQMRLSVTHSPDGQLQCLQAQELTPASTKHRARRNPNARAGALRRPESLN